MENLMECNEFDVMTVCKFQRLCKIKLENDY
jgi:hypothetical protein